MKTLGNYETEYQRSTNSLRNRVTNRLTNYKFNWQRQKLENCSNEPGKLYHDGQIITSQPKLAEIMNNFFLDKVATIRQGRQELIKLINISLNLWLMTSYLLLTLL